MKLLFSAKIEDLDILKSLLDREGIASEVTNDSVPLPGAEFYPKLWIVEDSEFPKAEAILKTFQNEQPVKTTTRGSWRCPTCGENIEEQFSSCWKCGTAREGAIS
jgi:hypothetical protein